MPKYDALIYRVEAESPEQGSPASRQLYQAWGVFNQEVATAGVMSSGTGCNLPPPPRACGSAKAEP